MIDDGDCGAIGEKNIVRGNRSTRRKPAPAPLCPPQIPHDQARALTRAAAVESQWLTTWAVAGPKIWVFLALVWIFIWRINIGWYRIIYEPYRDTLAIIRTNAYCNCLSLSKGYAYKQNKHRPTPHPRAIKQETEGYSRIRAGAKITTVLSFVTRTKVARSDCIMLQANFLPHTDTNWKCTAFTITRFIFILFQTTNFLRVSIF
jgi:hypothetical protein